MVDDAMVYPDVQKETAGPVENVWSLRRGFVLTALEGRRSPGFVPFETAYLSRKLNQTMGMRKGTDPNKGR